MSADRHYERERGEYRITTRVVTDYAIFAYLCDVVIEPSRRGRGLGKWLVESILAHPALQGLRRICLITRDAPWLYEPFGFTTDIGGSSFMEKKGLARS